jgi:2-polyprenyl-6-methoxyphenol hydroxylase-like FAD-dependent oxidoreductase
VSSQSSTVLIVGAGPSGMTAAMELARLQIPVRLVEKAPEPATTSRAIGVQARTLELFAQRGMVEPMLQKGNRSVAGSIYGEGKRIFRLEFGHNGSEFGYMLFISQAETEGLLRRELERLGVTIERQVEFIALSNPEHTEVVTAVLKHADGSIEEFRCAYLIDTEGAHSIGRMTLDLQFQGKTRDEDYALADVHIDGDLPATDFHIFSSEHGFMGLFPMSDGHFRLIASHPLSQPNKDTPPSLEEIQQIYDQRSHIPARFHDMSWSSWFRINSRMVDRLQVRRVFLGGDAAHIHSPAGGQGMNTGIQDMINLSWKLAFVIKGQAGEKLLETYSDDRIPVIRDVLTKTEGLTDAIGSENALFRSAFSYIAPWVVGTEWVQENATERMSQLSLNYRRSPLSASDGHAGEVAAGDRIPNFKLMTVGGNGEAAYVPKVEDLFHILSVDRFTLLFANLKDVAATHQSVQSLLLPWKSVLETYNVMAAVGQEEPFRRVFSTQPSLILVRPDGYAAFTASGNSLEALAKYLDTWLPVQQHMQEESAYV